LADAKAEYENFFRYSHNPYIGGKISIARIKFAVSELYPLYIDARRVMERRAREHGYAKGSTLSVQLKAQSA
jgi:hypothetical protein